MFEVFTRLFLLVTLTGVLTSGMVMAQDDAETEAPAPPSLLTDPFLQLPTEDGVYVVWFTDWAGQDHTVTYGADLDQTAEAETIQLTRTFEDAGSFVGDQEGDGSVYDATTVRPIYRHEAYVSGLEAGVRVPYFVTSVADDGAEVVSDEFSLAPLPEEGQSLTILLTSDHQLKPMTPANMQMVEETVGMVDLVLFAGDLENVPDRASEWFDDSRGFSFFGGLQGNGFHTLERSAERGEYTFTASRTWNGGEIIQNAPLFPVIGNHEVMGRYNPANDLGTQFNDPQPRWAAEKRYEELADIVNPAGDLEIREQWIRDNSFNTVTYEEIFTLPNDGPAGEQYYAYKFGDVYIVGLYSTRIWRSPSMSDDTRGKYREPQAVLNQPDNWGYGDFIFEDLQAGSDQYEWFAEVVNSEEFKNAPYKIVVMHQGPHGLGENSNPLMAHPVQIIDYNEDGSIAAVRYEYPLEDDILARDVEPIFDEAGVQLVHTGHSHLWWHLESDAGVDYLETSNVGNSYGCYVEGYKSRSNVPNDERFDADNYPTVGDPFGLEPIFPSEFSPLQNEAGEDLPCVDSNTLSVFSILTTEDGMVRSYVFDTSDPNTEPQLFDEFSIVE